MFWTLSYMALAFCLLEGLRKTADCLSEEKREGTLGLLFLTDLRGFDIVLGKLISHSLRAFYALVAAFPVLALPMLMGGVTGAFFGMSLLVICNTLFLSLGIGMFISSISREVTRAMALTFGVILLFVGGLPWLDLVLAGMDESKFRSILSIASPGHLFATVENLKPRIFWHHLELQHALAWLFLLLSCFCVPRAWKEKSGATGGWWQKLHAQWNFGGRKARLAFRQKLFRRNPIQWLAARDRGMLKLVSVLMIFSGAAIGWWIFLHWKKNDFGDIGFFILPLMPFLALWNSLRASDFLSTARRNGALELMLVAGMTPRELVRGQWAGLWKAFLFPVAFLAALIIAADIQGIRSMTQYNGLKGAQLQSMYNSQFIDLVIQLTYAFANPIALAWVGMWMGLTSRNTSVAVLKTVCLVCIIPFAIEIFLEIISDTLLPRAVRTGWGKTWPDWLGEVFIAALDLTKVLFLVVVARWRLLKTMRERAALGIHPKPRRQRSRRVLSIRAGVAENPTP